MALSVLCQAMRGTDPKAWMPENCSVSGCLGFHLDIGFSPRPRVLRKEVLLAPGILTRSYRAWPRRVRRGCAASSLVLGTTQPGQKGPADKPRTYLARICEKRLQLRRREESQSACKYRQKQAVRDILVKCRLRSAVTWIHRGVDRHVPLIRPCTTSCAVGLLASVSALSSHALVQAVLV